jgi:aspartate aminotransferase
VSPMVDNPIFAVAARADAMRSRGIDVITLAAGEPRAATSEAVVAAAVEAIRDPATHHYGQAQGDGELRELVAARLAGDTGLSWRADDVQVTLGAKHALFLAVHALITAGDQVIVAAPGWPGHAEAVTAAGGSPVHAATDEAFRLSPAALERCRTARTRAVIVASPGNPTGAVHSGHHLEAIAAWADRHDVWLITDDVYRAFDYTGTYRPLLRVAPHRRDRTIVVDGVSKEHAMTGWRVGWLAAPPHIVAAARRHVSRTVTHVPTFTQRAAAAALRDLDSPGVAAARYRRRRDLLVAALNDVDGVDCPLPDGGMFAFPSVAGLLRRQGWATAVDVADWLLDNAHVAVVPGDAFGAPDRLRLCFAVDDHDLTAATGRIQTAFSSPHEHEGAR